MADLMREKRKPDARYDLLAEADHAHPQRYRARVRGGGYRRTTVSLPDELYKRMGEHLKTRPGLTVSAFVSEAVAEALDAIVAPASER